MTTRPTDELMRELFQANHIDMYIKENESTFVDCTIADALQFFLEQKQLPKAVAIKNAEINEIYGFQIFSGKRKPSRDKLLCLCVGMKLNTQETQQLLKFSGYAPLYPKSKRDSIILFGINAEQNMLEINESLYSFDEPTLN